MTRPLVFSMGTVLNSQPTILRLSMLLGLPIIGS